MMSSARDMIAESVKRIFEERVDTKLQRDAEEGHWQASLWKLVEESGFTRVLTPEKLGGTGGGWTDAYPVMHAVGYWRVPLPIVETMIGNDLLARAGLDVNDGAVGLIQQDGQGSLNLALEGKQLRVSGLAKSVPWGRNAQTFVLSGQVDGRQVIARLNPGKQIAVHREGHNRAKEHRDHIRFDGCAAEEFAYADELLTEEAVKTHGALGRAIAISGAAESALAQSVRYSTERVQFGRAIARFQAIQHMLAVFACETTSAVVASEAACDSMHKKNPRNQIAVAKIKAGQAAGVGARIAHQVHGAFGMTYEHTLHFATRRMWAWRSEYGSESTWAEEIGAQAIRRGGENFWADVTARSAA